MQPRMQTFQTVGKLTTVQPEAEVCTIISKRLKIRDRTSGQQFLVDTGADISVLRGTFGTPADVELYAANGTSIKTFGEKTLVMNLGLRRPYRWTFIVADVRTPILGADFLAHHNLLVDLKNRKLIDGTTKLSIIADINCDEQPTIRTVSTSEPFFGILNRFPNVTKPSTMGNQATKHQVTHHIETTGPPVYCRTRPLPPDKYARVKKEFETLLELGVCRPSKSAWASPLHVVPKKNGEIRVCGDYRRLNAITKPDRYPIPRLQEFTYVLHGQKVFSKIDLNRAYHQIPVEANDVEKTAVITPFGLFEFPKMCFGLRNAGQTFQRFINMALQGLDFVFAYIDDILIASPDAETHAKHVTQVLERLDLYGITINPTKCEFNKKSLAYLGYDVTRDGIRPLTDRIQAINNFNKPTVVQELRRFLGMVNFYRECLPKSAQHQAELNKYLINTKKNDKTEIVWTPEATNAFELCKESIKNACLLAHPSKHANLSLMTDASDTSVGAVLQQRTSNGYEPLGFFSKNLSETQRRYSTYDRELLGIYMGIKHFRRLVEGRTLTVYTDHKPLIYAFKKNSSTNDTPRRIRQLEYIAQFCSSIEHISGEDNPVADFLSRIAEINCPSALDYKQLALSQKHDNELQQLISKGNSTLQQVQVPGTDAFIHCDTATGRTRPYLTKNFREQAFKAIHEIGRASCRARV